VTPSRIDAHLHLWDLEGGGYGWLRPEHGELYRSFGAEEAGAELTAAGIDAAILVQADDTRDDTESMLRAAREHSWIAGIVGWVPLDTLAAAEPEIERLAAEPLVRGLRHLVHDDPRDEFLALPEVRASLRLAAGRGLAFDVPDAWPRHLSRTVDLAHALPELTVVLDHLGKPPLPAATENFDSWRSSVRALAALPNSFAKVSGLRLPGVAYAPSALRPAWEVALEAFGPRRLMLGTDWPVSAAGGSLAEILAVLEDLVGELSPDEQEWLRGRTAAAAYRI
jgi:L-fuconolactonase